MNKRGCLIVGASGGLGRELSHQIASKGYRLFIHGRNKEKLALLSKELNGNTEIITQEFHTRDSIYSFIEKIRLHAEYIDIVIVNFGPFVEASITDMSPSQYEYIFDMNLLLPSLIITTLAPRMAERQWGRIILFGGTGTDQNRPYRRVAVYSAAKYGLNSIVRSAALEFGTRGVTVNLITPGYIETEYYDTKSLNNLKKKDMLLEPKKISDIIEFFISDLSAAINGAVINAGAANEWQKICRII